MRKALFLLALLICSINASGQVTVTATKYHPGMGGAGWVTASGSRIDNNKLKNLEIKWVALSPDMFKKLGVKMGDEVIIKVLEVDDRGRTKMTIKGVTEEEKAAL